jgi:hypothetical protein
MNNKHQDTGKPGRFPWTGVLRVALLAMLFLHPYGLCHGYIMPAEQILQLMAANFSEFETQVIVQSTQWKEGPGRNDQGDQGGSIVAREKIWVKSPNLFHSQLMEEGRKRKGSPDLTFRQLLVSNSPERLMAFLAVLGIDPKRVKFSRVHGVVVYQIGSGVPGSPRLCIDKETFLPVLLQYGAADGTGRHVVGVEFRNFRKVDKGWYPFEVSYRTSHGVEEIYTLETMETNVPVDVNIFVTTPEERSPVQPQQEEQPSPSEQERLRHIIKTFEEKYR